MGRRKLKKVKQKNHQYLSDEYNQVQEAIEMGVHLPGSIKKGKPVIINGSGGVNSSGGGFFYSTHKSCSHDGSKVVYEKDGKQIYGSSWVGLKEYSGNWDLIIDLAGNVKPAILTNRFIKMGTTARFKALDEHVRKTTPLEIPSEVLSLDWNDMGIPPVEYDFWPALWDMMPAKTVIACMGGHGRTGTCMVALLIVNGVDYWTALETVRAEHCDKAVESLKQEEYLHGLYVTYLNERLGEMQAEGNDTDAADILEDIKYAEANKPTNVTITATKQSNTSLVSSGGSHRWTSGESYPVLLGEFTLTQKMIAGSIHIQECTDLGCAELHCNIPIHQSWIQPKDSLYQHIRSEGVVV